MSKHEKMYKDSPSMERDDETGRVVVKKKKEGGDEGEKDDMKHGSEGIPAHARHHIERMEMHHKHQHEHHAHDHGGHGEKHEMHARHEHEMKTMHKRHDKELGGDKTGEAMIDKVQKDEKE